MAERTRFIDVSHILEAGTKVRVFVLGDAAAT